MENKKTIVIAGIVIAVALAGVAYYFFGSSGERTRSSREQSASRAKVIQENLVIPDTKNITGGEGRTVTEGSVEVQLVPKSEDEKVIVSKAVLTVKGSYDLAAPEAVKWSADAKLVFVKSLGAVTLEGKSSQWQIAFSAKSKQKGYEIIIQADQIVSQKEIDSTAVGADLPKTWSDSDGAIKSLQDLPQFSDATISSINLYYNADGKIWRYALSTSRGTTTMSVQ